jgi:hypothetical protein
MADARLLQKHWHVTSGWGGGRSLKLQMIRGILSRPRQREQRLQQAAKAGGQEERRRGGGWGVRGGGGKCLRLRVEKMCQCAAVGQLHATG